MDEEEMIIIDTPMAMRARPPEWGVMFHDGSVRHRWNGKSQEDRAREEWEKMRSVFPTDNIRLVKRKVFVSDWIEVQDGQT